MVTHLQKFYLNDDFSFIYNNMSHEFGVAPSDIKLVFKGNDKDYFFSDFQKILSKYWEGSPCQHWTRIEIQSPDDILWFGKRVIYGTHLYEIHFTIISKRVGFIPYKIAGSKCGYLNEIIIKYPIRFDMDAYTNLNQVLLEFHEDCCVNVKNIGQILKFKKLSKKTKAPRRATKGSVVYNLYFAKPKSISTQECRAVATDITLIAPQCLYPRAASRPGIALKNTNNGAGVIDVEYKSNLKVVIMNHSVDTHLHSAPSCSHHSLLSDPQISDVRL